jgi:hypothetical protein
MPPVPHRLHPSHLLKFLCHDQVKLLLERMDSHPEEFVYDRKWDNFLPPSLREASHKDLSMYKHFTSAERVAIYFKFKQLVAEIARPFAYGQILETIIDEDNSTKTFYSTSGHPVLGTPSYTVSTSQHIKLHQQVLHQAAKKAYGTSS